MNIHSGEVNRQLTLPASLTWVRGRFYLDKQNAWHSLSHDGTTATIDTLPHFYTVNDPVIHVWDAVGFEGPIALTQNGRLLAEDSERERLPRCNTVVNHCQVEWVSPDGLAIWGKCHHSDSRAHCYGHGFQIRLNLRPTFQVAFSSTLEDRIQAIVRPVTLRKKFKSIGTTETGQLTLLSAKGQFMSITSRQGMPLFTPTQQQSKLVHEEKFTLNEMDDIRYKLSTASWSDGSQAVLDSRGLLHLKPADNCIPEVTIVLVEGELTGWCADGRTFGKSYFLPESENYAKRADERRKICEDTIAMFVEGIRATS